MKIAVGADPFGLDLKTAVKQHLEDLGHACIDLGGTETENRAYYAIAHDLAMLIGDGECDRGVLICGTGMGMAIIANKHPGIYAAVCEDPSAAIKARSINNANVVTLGGLITAPYKANEIVDAFLTTDFKSGWDEDIQSFLDQSMADIQQMEAETFKS